jgi:hypothetical protein
MPQSLRQDGDPIERQYADLIEGSFPSYGRIWADLIGNDGASRLPVVEQLSDDVNRRRQFTSQYLYTVLICVICAQRETTKQSAATTIDEYLDAINKLVAVYGHLGRLRDCVERVGALWQLHDLAAPLESLYQKRNSVLHDVLPTAANVYGALAIIPPGGGLGVAGWGRTRTWSEDNSRELELLDDHVNTTVSETGQTLENVFARLHAQICDREKSTVFVLRDLGPLPDDAIVPSGSASPGLIFRLDGDVF